MMRSPTDVRRRFFDRLAGLPTAAAAALSLAALTSCAPQKVNSNCPQVYIAQDLGTLARFKPGTNREAGNLLYAAEIRDIKGDCSVNRTDADVDMTFSIGGERGSNSATAPGGPPLATANIVYFGAITDPTGLIVWKQEFTTTLNFGDSRRAGMVEELSPHIPLPKDAIASGYKVLIGFQLTPEEVEENRRRRSPETPATAVPQRPTAQPLPPAAQPVPPAPKPSPAPSPARRRPTVPPSAPSARPAPPRPPALPYLPTLPASPSAPAPAAPPARDSGDLLPGYVAPGIPAPGAR